MLPAGLLRPLRLPRGEGRRGRGAHWDLDVGVGLWLLRGASPPVGSEAFGAGGGSGDQRRLCPVPGFCPGQQWAPVSSLSCCHPATWPCTGACAPWPPSTGRSCSATSSPAGGALGRRPLGAGSRRAPGSSEDCGSCSSFKLFLELEPQIRDIIFKFYESKYASCLKMLDEMKVRGRPATGGAWTRWGRGAAPDQPPSPGQPAPGHVPGPSRQDPVHPDSQPRPHPGQWEGGGSRPPRAVGRGPWCSPHRPRRPQYFSPYVSADMRRMAIAFNTTVAALEDELTQLILEGLISARIDSHSKVAAGPGVGGGARAPLTSRPRRSCTPGMWTSAAPPSRSRCSWARSSSGAPRP